MKRLGFALCTSVLLLNSCGTKTTGESVVLNGNFSGGQFPWELTGDSSKVQYQKPHGLEFLGNVGVGVPVLLQNGKKYELSFSATSQTENSVLNVQLCGVGSNGVPANDTSFFTAVPLEKAKSRYSYRISLNKKMVTHSLFYLGFFADGSANRFLLDSVSLKEINPVESRVAKCQVSEIVQGDTAVISWKPHPYVNQVKIEYLKRNSPSNWIEITPHTPAQSESYKWEVPQDLGSSSIFVRVSSASSPQECEIIQSVVVK